MTKQEIKNNVSTIIELSTELKSEGYKDSEIIEIINRRLQDLKEEI